MSLVRGLHFLSWHVPDSRTLWKGELGGIAELPVEMGKALPDLLSVFLPEENCVPMGPFWHFQAYSYNLH